MKSNCVACAYGSPHSKRASCTTACKFFFKFLFNFFSKYKFIISIFFLVPLKGCLQHLHFCRLSSANLQEPFPGVRLDLNAVARPSVAAAAPLVAAVAAAPERSPLSPVTPKARSPRSAAPNLKFPQSPRSSATFSAVIPKSSIQEL